MRAETSLTRREAALVVLVHGIWMAGLEFLPMQRRLRARGFCCARFRYPSVRGGRARNVDALQDFLRAQESPVVHLVAHSLGGLLLHHLFQAYPAQRPGRVVTLGTPHLGSAVARRLHARRWGRALLGRSVELGLLGDAPPWPAQRELGVLAGTLGVGVGRVFAPDLEKPHDGTVSVAETRLPQALEWLTLETSHVGLVFSAESARQICNFLENGHFLR